MNNHLLAFERSVSSDSKEYRVPAKSMLTFMVKGLFTSFKFPYVDFSGTKTTGDNIFPPFWDVVKHLERIGLKVKFIFEQQDTMLKSSEAVIVNSTDCAYAYERANVETILFHTDLILSPAVTFSY